MSKSEDKFLAAGRSGKFSVTNWSAMTGIGNFDAVYSPQAGQMDVTFKVHTVFDDYNQKWSDEEKLKWEPLAFQIVEDFWSKRFVFECTRKDWGKHAVQVRIHVVPSSLASAHLKLKVQNVSPAIGTSGGGVGWSTTPPSCNIDNLAIYPKDQRKMREGIFNLRLYQISEGLRDRGLTVIPFGKNSAEIPGETKLKIHDYAKYVHRIATKDVTGIEIVVFGSTGGTDGPFQIGLGRRRAKAVADILKSVIRDDTMVVVTDSPSKKPGLKTAILSTLSANAGGPARSTAVQGVCILTHVAPDVDRAAERNYIVLCHEFGHMLGLPDEYMGRLHPLLTERANMDNLISQTLRLAVKSGDPAQWTEDEQRRADQQAGMAEMLRHNPGVRSPTYLDQTQQIANTQVASSSIMYSGMELMPAHYLTIWSCLAEMTWDHLNPSQWKIAPSPHNWSGIRYF